MELYDAIRTAQTMEQLEALREPIHKAATWNEIDVKHAKQLFMKRKHELTQIEELEDE